MDNATYFKQNYSTLQKVKTILDTNDPSYYVKIIVNEKPLDENTISIVMTACNRSVQTYFTLQTISKSEFQNIQVIIVDDSTHDKIQVSELEKFNFHIELINIVNKFWINPCVNYNIGFNQVKGGKIIIQNAEVCHVGDVINYVNLNVTDDTYHAFNVAAMRNSDCNKILHNIPELLPSSINVISLIMSMWYQHSIHRNIFYHFLTSLTKKTLQKIKGFDVDYSLGIEYDDNALYDQIVCNQIKLVNGSEDCFGIHQWHEQTSSGSYSNNFNNKLLYSVKKHLMNKYEKIISLSEIPKDMYDIIIDLLFALPVKIQE